MCSVLFLRTRQALSDEALVQASYFSAMRGPTSYSIERQVDADGRHLLFMHHLLDISGRGMRQPVLRTAEGGSAQVLLFNGEIYNLDSSRYASDTQYLAEQFLPRHGAQARELDGEYAVLCYDAARRELRVHVDPFLTKPLYIGRRSGSDDFGVSSYGSTLTQLGFDQVEMAVPNSTLRVQFDAQGAHAKCTGAAAWDFDLNQHKNSYDDWSDAFRAAVRKRATHGAFVPYVNLSSGYDSGAVCLALNQLGLPYETFSILAGENVHILRQRVRLNQQASCRRAHIVDGLNTPEIARAVDDIRAHVEPFTYVHDDGPGIRLSLQDDGGSIGVHHLGLLAQQAGLRVSLSGAGADEILSDYGIGGRKIYPHSEFGGVFPEDLRTLFPWKKFYGDSQRSYLFKEEFILGRHGIEGRYPFLDAALVQEFLWLRPELKNAEYKAPVAQFLRSGDYPFEQDAKRGFTARRDPWGRRMKLRLREWVSQTLR